MNSLQQNQTIDSSVEVAPVSNPPQEDFEEDSILTDNDNANTGGASDTLSPVETVEDPETDELDENEFQQMDNEVGSFPIDSVIDKYLTEIQRRISEGEISTEYIKSHFWIHPDSSYSHLSKNNIDPKLLCIPRVFLWLPHELQKDLNCPKCKTDTGFRFKEFNTKPRARRIVDLYE